MYLLSSPLMKPDEHAYSTYGSSALRPMLRHHSCRSRERFESNHTSCPGAPVTVITSEGTPWRLVASSRCHLFQTATQSGTAWSRPVVTRLSQLAHAYAVAIPRACACRIR